VVNALLTQLDKLKYQKNVLVMCTSNLVKAIGKDERGHAYEMSDYLAKIRPSLIE
jgi:AAA+ superfamily predicted ATPase